MSEPKIPVYKPLLFNTYEQDIPRELGPVLLLHPQIPRPIQGVNPRTILGQAWWDIMRRRVYARANYHCECCGVERKQAKFKPHLEAHEVYDIHYADATATFLYCVALCNACHSYIHKGRLLMLLKDQQITDALYNEIIDHGDAILDVAKPTKKLHPCVESTKDHWTIVIRNERHIAGHKWRPDYE